MTTHRSKTWNGWAALLLLGLLAGVTAPWCDAAIPEPATVFYGKVIGTGSAQPFTLTRGELSWTIRRADGGEVVLNTTLYPLDGGTYSYRLLIPHHVLALGLPNAAASVPLGADPATHEHVGILVEGVSAQPVGDGARTFDAAQVSRAATYRLDLAVGLTAPDSDLDGIADWWEDRYGTDKQNGADGGLDPDGDGISNLDEYLAGTDPSRDDRQPLLLTTDMRAYADGTTGIRLDVTDTDSAPSDLVYRVESAPDAGRLVLRDVVSGGAESDRELAAGASFTQADVAAGRLVYRDASATLGLASTSFQVSLNDEQPLHAATGGTIVLQLYRPDGGVDDIQAVQALAILDESLSALLTVPENEQPEGFNYVLSRELDYVIWDASDALSGVTLRTPSSGLDPADYASTYQASFGADLPQVLCGGTGRDRLDGSMESDVIMGGPGDDMLSGCGGSDLFIFRGADAGHDAITDFSLADGDVIDVSGVMQGGAGRLEDYLEIVPDADDSMIRIAADGSGPPYNDMSVNVAGSELLNADIYALVADGSLRVGDKALAPRVSIAATTPAASENGPTPGSFTITREGDPTAEIVVDLVISGSAQNGLDYSLLPTSVSFAAGQVSATLVVQPYIDAITELAEVVDIMVADGGTYAVSSASRATLSIGDLSPQITIEALEVLAVQDTSRAGVFLLTRSGVLDRSVLVRLDISGSAVEGADYLDIPAYVNLAPQQTTALIEITPRAGADFSTGARDVDIAVQPDAAYLVASPDGARVIIVGEQLTLAQWRDRHFPEFSGDLDAFALADSGEIGVPNLLRYAFGLDPESPLASGGPRFEMVDGHLVVTFRQPASATDISYIVEISGDLMTWDGDPNRLEVIEMPANPYGVEGVSLRSRQGVSDVPRQFMRMRVIHNP